MYYLSSVSNRLFLRNTPDRQKSSGINKHSISSRTHLTCDDEQQSPIPLDAVGPQVNHFIYVPFVPTAFVAAVAWCVIRFCVRVRECARMRNMGRSNAPTSPGAHVHTWT